MNHPLHLMIHEILFNSISWMLHEILQIICIGVKGKNCCSKFLIRTQLTSRPLSDVTDFLHKTEVHGIVYSFTMMQMMTLHSLKCCNSLHNFKLTEVFNQYSFHCFSSAASFQNKKVVCLNVIDEGATLTIPKNKPCGWHPTMIIRHQLKQHNTTNE